MKRQKNYDGYDYITIGRDPTFRGLEAVSMIQRMSGYRATWATIRGYLLRFHYDFPLLDGESIEIILIFDQAREYTIRQIEKMASILSEKIWEAMADNDD